MAAVTGTGAAGGPLLEIRDLKVDRHSDGEVRRVLDVDELVIERGETYGIVGESGAGKTVLALSILGLLPSPPGKIASGRVMFDGVDLLRAGHSFMARRIRGRRIAMIFQDPMSTLNPVFSVGAQMSRVARRGGGAKSAARDRSAEMLERVKLPDPASILEKYPHQLSGGQRQRVIIAMALLCGAELVIADEPTRNLDATIQASILLLFKELQREFRMTVLFIANNLGLIPAFCDRAAILRGGVITERGAVGDVIGKPADDYTRALISAASQEPRKRGGEFGDVLLGVSGLKKHFPAGKGLFVKAVDGVDMTARSGEIVGIVGESGCGKSTLVNTILNLHPPTEGTVVFDGDDMFSLGGEKLREARKKIQIVFQDPYWSLNPRWLVRDIVAEPLRVHERMSRSDEADRVASLLGLVGLKPSSALLYPHEFSGGERQRIAIARSIAVNPKMVVLDEPTSAIDVVSQAQILKLIERLREDFSLTNLLISHDMGVVSRLANRIIVMYLGKIVESGPTAEVFRTPLHPYTRALFASIPKIGVSGLFALEGEIPSALSPPSGCGFHPRCPAAAPECREAAPRLMEAGDAREVACFMVTRDGG